MKKIAIFDFDGTLANTRPVILCSFHETFDVLQLPQRSDKEISATIGLPLIEAFPILFPMSEEKAQKCADTYRKIFEKVKKDLIVQLFPHVADTLKQLHSQGVICTIATSRGHESASHFIQSFGLDSIITYIIAAENVQHAKPNPEPVNLTLSHFGINPEDAVVIGDTHFDILMGNNTSCMSIGVSYGYGSRESLEKAGADVIIDDFAELPTYILNKHTHMPI